MANLVELLHHDKIQEAIDEIAPKADGTVNEDVVFGRQGAYLGLHSAIKNCLSSGNVDVTEKQRRAAGEAFVAELHVHEQYRMVQPNLVARLGSIGEPTYLTFQIGDPQRDRVKRGAVYFVEFYQLIGELSSEEYRVSNIGGIAISRLLPMITYRKYSQEALDEMTRLLYLEDSRRLSKNSYTELVIQPLEKQAIALKSRERAHSVG
jgi:hypothetical protein